MSRYQASQGPDITDVMLIIEEIKRLHGADVSVDLRPCAGKYTAGVSVTMVATHPTLVGPGRTWSAKVIREFPSKDHKTFEGLLYSMALWVDRRCAQDLWNNSELPF